MPTYNDRKLEQLAIVNKKFARACNAIIDAGGASNISQIAEMISYPQNVLSDVMNGKRNVTIDQMISICRIYKVNPAFLLPPWSKDIFVKASNRKLIKQKKAEIAQLNQEIQLLTNQ